MGEQRRKERAPQRRERILRGRGIERPIAALERRQAAKEPDRAAGNLPTQRARSSAERVLTRTTSGAIYAVLTLACIFAGPVPTTLLICAEAWLCCSEFYRIARMGGRMPNEVIGLAAAALFPLAAYAYGLVAMSLILFVLLMACACWYVFTPRANIADVSVTVFGPLYTSFAFASVVFVRKADPGLAGAVLSFGVMGSVWFNDAMAYFVGSAMGAHKLAPRISPKKSVEGFVGGLLGSVAVWALLSVLLSLFDGPQVEMPLALVCGLVVGLASVVGDLFESRLKRGVGVKDSGNLIPGHGGLLDRTDSMLFGALTAFFLLLFGGVL